MPYYATSQEWLHQSSLLLEARPSTTRITTKYHISKPKPRRPSQKPSSTTSSAAAAAAAATQAPRGSLTLKTYDPHSGACLKYRTTKAAEVSRLILSLGRPLGGRMAALPQPEAADEVMADVPEEATGGGATVGKKGEEAGAASSAKPQGQQQQGSGGGSGGGKGKKKRGKK